jgi:hypothetical protein
MTGKDINSIVLVASVASIAASIYLFGKGSRDTGIFVGLWAPTFLSLGSFANRNGATDNVSAGASVA